MYFINYVNYRNVFLSIFIVKWQIQTIRIFACFTIQTLNFIFVATPNSKWLLC